MVFGQTSEMEIQKIMSIKNLDKRIQAGALYFQKIADENFNEVSDDGKKLFASAKKTNDKHMQAVALSGLSYASYIVDNKAMSYRLCLKSY